MHPNNIITKKSVENVANRFQLNANGQYHPDDPTSIELFVQEQKEKKEILFLVYKKQGDPLPGLEKGDFMLAFMTPFQKKMIRDLQKKKSIVICMDATHETNGYNFLLITVMTKDNSGEGLPLAHMFSSKEDAVALKYFLQGIRSECGPMKCEAFMSDDASQYFQPWSSVMVDKDEDPPTKLLCALHVTRSFERNILSNLKKKELKEEVFHSLKVIMSELDEEKSVQMLTKFRQELKKDPEKKKFSEYFESKNLKNLVFKLV